MPRTKTSAATTTKTDTHEAPKRTVRRRPISDVVPASGAHAIDELPRLQPTQEEIARRAFELYLERGGEHGHHDEDWALAERELASQLQPA